MYSRSPFGRLIPAMVTPFDENLELEAKVRRALSLDALIKIDRGWHHAPAQG